jgi:hypothetical protein
MSVGTVFNSARLLGDGTKKSRMAGTAWAQFLQWLKNSAKYGVTGSLDHLSNTEKAQALALRFVPDAIGGTIVGATTPGDLGDKFIAGTTDALAGAIGGVGLAGATRAKGALGIAADMAGSYGGAFASMPAANQMLRMKDSLSGGEGKSPYEKMDDQYRKDIENALLTKLGFGPMY